MPHKVQPRHKLSSAYSNFALVGWRPASGPSLTPSRSSKLGYVGRLHGGGRTMEVEVVELRGLRGRRRWK
ncbi:hypothetical protein E2C01_043827 [Portunus trituberculatus]|uniref:Uncharacterized protein n=1 Tax=Portunus trituberculatus TaxID=210409 RepID=A0A5B7FYR1_PORTR|nr:hypothetical protein [Portunus trituberculatus]